MKITIIGTGAYSIAIALMLAKKKNNYIVMWSENSNLVDDYQKNHQTPIFPKLKMPNNIEITNSYQEALKETNLIFLITSAKYIIDVCKNMELYYKNTPICIASKGIHHESLSTLADLVKKRLKTNNIAVISGPTFAIDLVNENPCALAIAGFNKKTVSLVIENLQNTTLKLRYSSDIKGIQLCGSLKNIIAIAAGILKGLGCTESTRAFLINEAVHDLKEMIHALGGKKKTILSYAGIGDLLLTCSSEKSRNFSFGEVIGRTKDKNKIQDYLDNFTVEGYYTLLSISKLLEKRGINIPLIKTIYNIVYENENPDVLKTFLITKD